MITDFLEDLLARLRAENKDLLDRINETGQLSDEDEQALGAVRSVRWSTTSAQTSTKEATLWRRASPTGSSRRPSVPPVPRGEPGPDGAGEAEREEAGATA